MQTGLERQNTARKFSVDVTIDNDLIRNGEDLGNALRQLADRVERESLIAGLSSQVLYQGSVVGRWSFSEGIRG